MFKGATTYPCIIRIRKSAPRAFFDVTQVKTLDFQSLSDYVKENHYSVNLGDLPVFLKATTYPCILRISKEAPVERFSACQVGSLSFFSLSDYVDDNSYDVRESDLDDYRLVTGG